MPHSPLILKIRVHNPNKKGAANANRNGLHYIATREGVSLERIDTVDDLLKIEGMEEKEIRESLVHQEASDENYLRYIAKRPRSHGLIGNVNTEDLKAMEQEVASLTKAGRIIYRGVISLSEQDAIDLGYRNINAWNNYLWPKIVLQKNESVTMPMLVANLKSGYSIDYGMLMLGVLICTLPTAVIFLCLQKSFANGITGAVK